MVDDGKQLRQESSTLSDERLADPLGVSRDGAGPEISGDRANGNRTARIPVGRKGCWTAGLLTFAAVFAVIEVGIHRQPGTNFLPDDTIALMAAMGRIDDFGKLMRGRSRPVLARAADVRSLIYAPDPAGPWETIRSLKIGDMHPPAFFLLLRGWAQAFGMTYARLASLNALLVATAVGILAAVMVRACGWWGLLLSTAVGFSPGATMSAFEIRPNALAALGLVLAMAAVMAMIPRRAEPVKRHCVFLCLGCVLAAYAHYMTSLAIVTLWLGVLLIAAAQRNWRNARRLTATAIVSALLMLPLIPLLRAQQLPVKKSAAERGQATVEVVSTRLAGVTGCLALNVVTIPRQAPNTIPVIVGAGLLLGSVGLSIWRRQWEVALLLGIALVLLCIVPAVLTSLRLMPRHSVQPKYYFGFAMVFAPLIALALTGSGRRVGRLARALLAVVFVPIIALSLWLILTFHRPSYITVTAGQDPALLARADVVLIDSVLRGFVLPVAANAKESAYLVMGRPGEIQEWIRRDGLLMIPGRYGFYYRVGGASSPFILSGGDPVDAAPAHRLGS